MKYSKFGAENSPGRPELARKLSSKGGRDFNWHIYCDSIIMEKRIITVYLNSKPYKLSIDIDRSKEITTYRVINNANEEELEDFIPDNLEFDEDGQMKMDDRIQTTEGIEIAKAIWRAIDDQLNTEE